MNKLESMLNGQVIIFDNSAMNPQENPPLPELLHEGLNGLRSTPASVIEDRIHRIDQIKLLLSKPEFVVIEEVYKELEEYFRIINGQCKHLSARLPRVYKDKKNKASSNKLELLRQYCDEFFNILNAARNRDPRKLFNQNHLNSFFSIAYDYTKEIKEAEVRNKMRLDNPTLLGQKLGTFFKIAATAFTISYEKDTLIVTPNKNLSYTVDLISKAILIPERRIKYGLDTIPKYSVSVFNPNLEN